MHLLTYAKHWISRIVALIFLPSVIYIAGFYIHFLILTHTGTEEANSFMSPLFQAGLAGNSLNSNPAGILLSRLEALSRCVISLLTVDCFPRNLRCLQTRR
ncbi:hypothetical protein BC830DRAFT_91623 [Chytriomyces sp. MP71]|nr:hypothetical protein BC830DRAFT_91623 [Chytriomyces sp. MP71]